MNRLDFLKFRVNHDIMDMISECITHHKATLDDKSPRDFIDKMLIGQQTCKQCLTSLGMAKGSVFYGRRF